MDEYRRTKKRETSWILFVFSTRFGKLSLLQENDEGVLHFVIIVNNLIDTTLFYIY